MNVTAFNLADMVDPNDPQGRTWRQINAARQHAIPVGSMVELESGVRLFVVHRGRDCDQTPLYTLAPELFDGDEVSKYRWWGGHSEESLIFIKPPA